MIPMADDKMTLSMDDPAYRDKLKDLESKGWRFTGKEGNTIYLKKDEDPLFSLDSDSLILIGFVMFFVLLLLVLIIF